MQKNRYRFAFIVSAALVVIGITGFLWIQVIEIFWPGTAFPTVFLMERAIAFRQVDFVVTMFSLWAYVNYVRAGGFKDSYWTRKRSRFEKTVIWTLWCIFIVVPASIYYGHEIAKNGESAFVSLSVLVLIVGLVWLTKRRYKKLGVYDAAGQTRYEVLATRYPFRISERQQWRVRKFGWLGAGLIVFSIVWLVAWASLNSYLKIDPTYDDLFVVKPSLSAFIIGIFLVTARVMASLMGYMRKETPYQISERQKEHVKKRGWLGAMLVAFPILWFLAVDYSQRPLGFDPNFAAWLILVPSIIAFVVGVWLLIAWAAMWLKLHLRG